MAASKKAEDKRPRIFTEAELKKDEERFKEAAKTPTGWKFWLVAVKGHTLHDCVDSGIDGLLDIFVEFEFNQKKKGKNRFTYKIEISEYEKNKGMSTKEIILNTANPLQTDEEFDKKLQAFMSESGHGKKYLSVKLTMSSLIELWQEWEPEEYYSIFPEMVYKSPRYDFLKNDWKFQDWIIDYPYTVDEKNGKLYRYATSKSEDGDDIKVLISDLVLVTAEYQDMAKENEIYFRYLIKNGKRKEQTFMMSAGKISDKELMDDIRRRIIVIYGEEKHFNRFLTLFAMRNRDENKLAHYYFSSRTGWTVHEGKQYFLLGSRIFDVESNYMSPAVPTEEMAGYEDFFAGIADSGNYDEWVKEWIPAIRAADPTGCQIFLDNTNLWFTIYALSASLLMNQFPGIENTLIINSGTTSRGKSTIAKIAASMFGDPKKFITLGSGTENGIWNAWLKWNYLPSIMDEFTNTKQETKNKIPYWFSDGKEKSRLNKDSTAKKVNEFRKIGYISLENDFVNQVMRSGVDARVIPLFDGLNLPDTEDENVNTARATLIDDLARVKSHKYFGFYKYEFLKTLAEVGTDRVTELYENVSKTYTTTNDTLTARLGASFALFHVSGILVEMTNERLRIRGQASAEEMNQMVENRCREILDKVVQNIGDHDWQVVLADVLARADNSETRTRWLTDEQLMHPYRPDDEYSIRYPDKIEAWFCNDGMIEFVDVAPDVVKTVCISTVGKPSMNNVLKEWTDKKIIKPLRDDQRTVMQRHYDVQGGKKVRTPVYRIDLKKAKELTGYDLLYRRRELLDEIQTDLEEFSE